MVCRWNSELGHNVCSPKITRCVRLRAKIRTLDTESDGQVFWNEYGLITKDKNHEDDDDVCKSKKNPAEEIIEIFNQDNNLKRQ